MSRQCQRRPLAPPVPSVVWMDSLVTGAPRTPAPSEGPLVTWLLVPKTGGLGDERPKLGLALGLLPAFANHSPKP